MAVTETGNRLVIVDAGPVLHLDELGALSALAGFDDILITRTVWKEIRKHRNPELKALPIRYVPDPEPDTLVEGLSKTFLLHAGEKTALSLSRRIPGAIFATDDTAARLAGNQLGLRVHGSLGLLLRSIRMGQLSKEMVLGILGEIPTKSTLFIKPSLLLSVIQKVERFEHE